MDLPPEQAAALLAAGALGPRFIAWVGARFVSKADDTARQIASERDEREKAMALKLEEIASSIAELRSDARNDRERQAALTAAHAEVKERINGVSENHRPRIERLEQKVAVLEAQATEKARRR